MIHSLTPLLRTPDLAATLAFYVDVLGFRCDAGGAQDGWASLQWDRAALMLSGLNAHQGDVRPAFTGSLYLRCDDVDAWWQRLKERVRVCYALEDFSYGMREFAIYDNNGYLLQFGQPITAEHTP